MATSAGGTDRSPWKIIGVWARSVQFGAWFSCEVSLNSFSELFYLPYMMVFKPTFQPFSLQTPPYGFHKTLWLDLAVQAELWGVQRHCVLEMNHYVEMCRCVLSLSARLDLQIVDKAATAGCGWADRAGGLTGTLWIGFLLGNMRPKIFRNMSSVTCHWQQRSSQFFGIYQNIRATGTPSMAQNNFHNSSYEFFQTYFKFPVNHFIS